MSREQVLAYFFESLTVLTAKSFAEVLLEYQEHDMLKGNLVRVYHQARGVSLVFGSQVSTIVFLSLGLESSRRFSPGLWLRLQVDDKRDFDAEVQGFQADGSLVVVDGAGKAHELSGK